MSIKLIVSAFPILFLLVSFITIEAATVTQVGVGSKHSAYLKDDGTLWAMGKNDFGQLGDGTQINRTSSPVKIASGVIALESGEFNTFYLLGDGSLMAVGNNQYGQLGDGTTTDRNSSVLIDSAVSSVSAGASQMFYIKSDGTLWATGRNNYGQLGDGTVTDRKSPVLIDNNVSFVSAGESHVMYIKTDKTLLGLGRNNYGQLGDGNVIDLNSSTIISTSVSKVSAGGNHTIYLKEDQTLWVTGRNDKGQLGNGTLVDRNTSVQVDLNVTDIVTGESHSLYLKTDGSLWGMGRNDYGQLGNGTSVDSNQTMKLVDGNVSVIAAGGNHSFYLTEEKILFGMGRNEFGQLGNGGISNVSNPAMVKINNLILSVQEEGGATSGGGNYSPNSTATISAMPSPGYLFSQWSGGANENSSTTTISMANDLELTASFTRDLSDLDGDGLSNYLELVVLNSDSNDSDSDDDGFSDFDENKTGLDPSVSNAVLYNYVVARENNASMDGNLSGIAYVQANPNTYNLYTESDRNEYGAAQRLIGVNEVTANPGLYNLYTEVEKNASVALAKEAGKSEALATVQADLASQGLTLLGYVNEMNATKLYTSEWHYQPGMGWLWTSESVFPFFYRAEQGQALGGWLYFGQLPNQLNASFYDYSTQTWITPSSSQ